MKKIKKYLLIFWGIFFILIFSMGATKHVLEGGSLLKGSSKDVVIFFSSLLHSVKEFYSHEKPQVVEIENSFRDGFSYSSRYNDSKDYLLVSSWDNNLNQSVVKLIRIDDGKLMHQWIIDIDKHISEFNTYETYGIKHNLTIDKASIQHPFLDTDGSLVFAMGGRHKVDLNGDLIWSESKDCHHSIEKNSDKEEYWMCSYNSNLELANKLQIRDDALIKINGKTGALLYEKSIYEIFIENGIDRGELFINPQITTLSNYLDYFHLNDVQPVLEDGPYWEKGDVFFSLRHQNLIGLYRPKTGKLLWYKRGPWLRQHDIDILDSTRISIYGNNTLDAKFSNSEDLFIDGNNEVYVYDFIKDSVSKPFSELFSKEKIRTHTEGLARVVSDSFIFVEETNKGRILLGDQTGVLWTYVERVDDKHVSRFSWSRYITKEEFSKLKFLKK